MDNEQKKETTQQPEKKPFWQQVKTDYKKIMETPDPKAEEREAAYQAKRAKAREDLKEMGGMAGCVFKGIFFLVFFVVFMLIILWFTMKWVG